MIVYKIKDSKIVGISRKDENYVIKENEYQTDTWFQKPFFNGTEVIESITQEEIDEIKIKADKEYAKKVLLADKVVIWQGFTPDGLKEIALILQDDGKTATIEI